MSTATIRPPLRPVQYITSEVSLSIRAEGDLPPGIAGRVSGVALTYEVVDSYQTIFARGCAKRSIDNKVKARKVPLLMDHSRTVGAHVGVVASMVDSGDQLIMTADLFDTPEGRAALEYVKTVIAAGASTGFSIGFVPRRTDMVMMDAKPVEKFLEIELREVSLTPMPAVPGADVTGARAEDSDETQDAPVRPDAELLETAAIVALEAMDPSTRAAVLSRYQLPASTATTTAARCCAPVIREPVDAVATMDARVQAVRSTFAVPPTYTYTLRNP